MGQVESTEDEQPLPPSTPSGLSSTPPGRTRTSRVSKSDPVRRRQSTHRLSASFFDWNPDQIEPPKNKFQPSKGSLNTGAGLKSTSILPKNALKEGNYEPAPKSVSSSLKPLLSASNGSTVVSGGQGHSKRVAGKVSGRDYTTGGRGEGLQASAGPKGLKGRQATSVPTVPTASVPVPEVLGNRVVQVVNLGTMRQPQPELLGQGERAPSFEERGNRARGRKKDDKFIMKRFSFMRQPSMEPIRLTSSKRDIELDGSGTKQRVEYDNDDYNRNKKRIVILDSSEIIEIADSTHHELVSLEYSLHQWEQIYRQLSSMYEKFERNASINYDPDLDNSFELERVNSEIRVPKWTLERALDKVSRCIQSNPDYKARQVRKLEIWEEDNEITNEEALEEMKKYVPEDIKKLSAKDLVEQHGLSWPLAKRLVEKKVFHVFYMTVDEISKIYTSDFSMKGRFDYTGLDIIELRAVYAATNGVKTKWRKSMRQLLFDYSVKEQKNTLGKFYQRHHAYTYQRNGSNHPPTMSKERRAQKDHLTNVLRAKAKCLFSELEHKSVGKKQELVSRVERFTGSKHNKYTRMVRRQLSLSEEELEELEEEEEEEDSSDSDEELESEPDSEPEDESPETVKAKFDNFYRTGSFEESDERTNKMFPVKKKLKKKAKKKKRDNESDSDMEEMDSIEQLVRQLRDLSTSSEDLEVLLASIFQ